MTLLESPQSRAAALIVLLGLAIAIAVSPYAIGLLGAGVLYVMFAGMYRALRPLLRSHGAATVTLIAAILLVVLPLTWIVGLVVDQAPDTLAAVQSAGTMSRLSTITVGKVEIGAEIAKASGTLVTWLSRQAMGFVGGAATWPKVREYVPFSPEAADNLKERFFSITKATLLGTALVAVLQGGLVGIGFAIVGLPSAAFWGVMTGIASILPVLGSALVWVPGVIVLLVQGAYGSAALLAVIGGVVASNIDNVIRPMVYKRVSDIHPLITLIGAFAGVQYFGLLGVLLGPLAIAYFFELLRLYGAEYGSRAAT
jgi:predicted PurR-regulated permease PerM